MLLPDKHISFAESLLGLGSFVLESLRLPQDVDALWRLFEKSRGGDYPAYHSFDNLVLTVDILYAMGIINMDDNGKLVRQVDALGSSPNLVNASLIRQKVVA